MGKYFTLIIILSLFFSDSTKAQTSDSTLNALLAIDESQFIGKPLDSIIAVLPQGYIEMRIFGIRNTARKINILYPNRVWIELHVREFSYMEQRDVNRVWNMTLMRKEKLYRTVIYKHLECYRNCDIR